jgi:hypothetical protein
MAALATKPNTPKLCAKPSQNVSLVGIEEPRLSLEIINSKATYQITETPIIIKGFMVNRLVR